MQKDKIKENGGFGGPPPMGVQGARPPLGGPGGQRPPEEIEFQRFEMQNMPSPGLKDDVLRVIQQ